jgi:hypothetical protein
LKVKPTDSPVAIQHLADQIEAWNQFGLHRPEIDLAQRHATGRHFSEVPATVISNRQDQRCQRLDQPLPRGTP